MSTRALALAALTLGVGFAAGGCKNIEEGQASPGSVGAASKMQAGLFGFSPHSRMKLRAAAYSESSQSSSSELPLSSAVLFFFGELLNISSSISCKALLWIDLCTESVLDTHPI